MGAPCTWGGGGSQEELQVLTGSHGQPHSTGVLKARCQMRASPQTSRQLFQSCVGHSGEKMKTVCPGSLS